MGDEIRLTIRNDLRELARVNEAASAFLDRHRIAPRESYATSLVLEEVLSNVVRHAYGDATGREIAVALRLGERGIEIEVVDDGRAFDPADAPRPDLDATLAERRIGGLGVHLVRAMASEIRYARRDGKNHLHVRI